MESFHPRTEGLPWSRSIPVKKDSPVIVLSQDRITPLESFHPRKKMTPTESFLPRTE